LGKEREGSVFGTAVLYRRERYIGDQEVILRTGQLALRLNKLIKLLLELVEQPGIIFVRITRWALAELGLDY
jgi:hypothetical protein